MCTQLPISDSVTYDIHSKPEWIVWWLWGVWLQACRCLVIRWSLAEPWDTWYLLWFSSLSKRIYMCLHTNPQTAMAGLHHNVILEIASASCIHICTCICTYIQKKQKVFWAIYDKCSMKRFLSLLGWRSLSSTYCK